MLIYSCPFYPPPPASGSDSTLASTLSSPLLGEPWLGQCRWKGPPLRATALTACEGSVWVSLAQPYQTHSSPSVCNIHTQTHTHGQCIPSRALRSPSQPLCQTSAAGEVKPPHVSKRENSRRTKGGSDRGMGEKRGEKVYLHVHLDVCLGINSPCGCHCEGEEGEWWNSLQPGRKRAELRGI